MGWRQGSAVECLLLLPNTRVLFPAPSTNDSQLPVTAAPEDPTPSSGALITTHTQSFTVGQPILLSPLLYNLGPPPHSISLC